MNLKEKGQSSGPLSRILALFPGEAGEELWGHEPRLQMVSLQWFAFLGYRLPFSFVSAAPALLFLITQWQGQTEHFLLATPRALFLPAAPLLPLPHENLSSTLFLGHLTPCSEENHMEILARTFRSAQKS